MQRMRRLSGRRIFLQLLLAEGLAVGALLQSGILLVGAHQNLVQGTVVGAVAMVCALLNGAFDALVCIVIHIVILLYIGFGSNMTRNPEN